MTAGIYHCDCGQLAYKRDGSGWFCQDCEEWVEQITELIHAVIFDQRGVSEDEKKRQRHERYLRYKSKNREKILNYQREYDRTRRQRVS